MPTQPIKNIPETHPDSRPEQDHERSPSKNLTDVDPSRKQRLPDKEPAGKEERFPGKDERIVEK